MSVLVTVVKEATDKTEAEADRLAKDTSVQSQLAESTRKEQEVGVLMERVWRV